MICCSSICRVWMARAGRSPALRLIRWIDRRPSDTAAMSSSSRKMTRFVCSITALSKIPKRGENCKHLCLYKDVLQNEEENRTSHAETKTHTLHHHFFETSVSKAIIPNILLNMTSTVITQLIQTVLGTKYFSGTFIVWGQHPLLRINLMNKYLNQNKTPRFPQKSIRCHDELFSEILSLVFFFYYYNKWMECKLNKWNVKFKHFTFKFLLWIMSQFLI